MQNCNYTVNRAYKQYVLEHNVCSKKFESVQYDFVKWHLVSGKSSGQNGISNVAKDIYLCLHVLFSNINLTMMSLM